MIKQEQVQKQKQTFRFSQSQIQGVSFLSMNSMDLRNEILRAAGENPAIEIVSDRFIGSVSRKRGAAGSGDSLMAAMEQQESHQESLQAHLLHQLYSMNLTEDEKILSEKLIYNLDKNGCYGSSLSPDFLLDKKRPAQNIKLLNKCIDRIQRMDPIGTCCRTPEESLFVQAKIRGDASELTLFILDNHLDILNPPKTEKIISKLETYRENWHKKTFAKPIVLDSLKITEKLVQETLEYILSLNPRPAQDYVSDISSEFEQPDVVLTISKVAGKLAVNNYERGLVCGDETCHFQIKYASGVLPEVQLSRDFKRLPDNVQGDGEKLESYRKECLIKAEAFINNLLFRESTIILQGCAIVNAQRVFFLKGPGNLNVLSRRQIADELQIHESTVSRTASKKNSKFIQCDWGIFPASYFFSSGVNQENSEKKISAEVIKQEMRNIILENGNLSDSKLAMLLNEKGIKIARRTVAKYRQQAGIDNSYSR